MNRTWKVQKMKNSDSGSECSYCGNCSPGNRCAIFEDVNKYEKRYVITDEDGNIIDDAQGYGYKSFNKASKAAWYKFEGGKQKIKNKESEKKRLFKSHPGLEKHIDEFYEMWLKEFAIGDVTNDDLVESIKEEFGIDFPKKFL